MTPYFDDGKGRTIYLGDCREIMPGLPKVDVVVTDPPYGCSATTGWGGRYDGFQIAGDLTTDLRDHLIAHVSCPWAVFGSPRIQRPACSAVLIWAKGEHTGMGDLTFPWKPDFEEIYVQGRCWSGARTSSVLRYTARIDSERLHPTEKPTGLLREIIGKAPAGSILDPFMGSGTTLVAAKELGRKAVGIEIVEKYCEVAARRLEQEIFDFASGEQTS
jgi:DNA modification methylase